MKTMILVLVALMGVTGCAGDVWYVDSRFSAEEEKQIQAAEVMWEEAGAPTFAFFFRQHVNGLEQGQNVIVRSRSDRESAGIVEGWSEQWSGSTTTGKFSTVIVLMPDFIEKGTFPRLAAHELGHAHIGPGIHATSKDAVMFISPGSDSLTAEDLHLLHGAER